MTLIESIRKLFGERVRHFRKIRGWELDDLGVRLNKSRASISRIENGKQNLTMMDIAALAQALEVPVDALFRESDLPTQGSSVVPDAIQKTARRCQQAASDLQEVLVGVSTIAAELQTYAAAR